MSKRPSLKNPAILIATWFGAGYLPKAPGTWGSLAALPFGIALSYAGLPVLYIGIFAVTVLGFWAAHEYDRIAEAHDSKEIVIDEVAGQWIALIPAALDPVLIAAALGLFRLFDVLKPWPVSFFDRRLKGPLSVMGDDIVAGLFAAICIYGAIYAGLG